MIWLQQQSEKGGAWEDVVPVPAQEAIDFLVKMTCKGISEAGCDLEGNPVHRMRIVAIVDGEVQGESLREFDPNLNES